MCVPVNQKFLALHRVYIRFVLGWVKVMHHSSCLPFPTTTFSGKILICERISEPFPMQLVPVALPVGLT